MPALFPRLSLKWSAPLVLCLPVLLAVVLLTSIGFYEARSAANVLAKDHLEEVHRRIDERLTDLFGMPRRANRMNALMLDEGLLPLDDMDAWTGHLNEVARTFDMLSGSLIGTAEGRVAWVFRYPGKPGYELGIKQDGQAEDVREYNIDADGRLSAAPIGEFAYDPRRRPWYLAAEAAEQATWNEYAWVNTDGSEVTYGLAYTEPYYDTDGNLLAVLDSEVSMHDVAEFLARQQVGQHGLVFVADRGGLLVASSTSAKIHDEQIERIPVVASDHSWIAAVGQHLESDLGSLADLEQYHQSHLEIDGQRFLVLVTPLRQETGLTWLIATVVPEQDFLGEVYAGLTRTALFGLLAVLFTLAIGVGISYVLTRPIFALLAHVRGIGGGDLESEVRLTHAREFADLSAEINRMTEGLRDRLRLRHSLALAMDVQQNLLPRHDPRIAGLDIAGHSTYCDETGGDYYDYLDIGEMSDSAVAVAVGDVMGHGVAAAMLMATARGILRSRCQEPGTLGELLAHMNQMLVADTGGERFMTMMLAVLDVSRGTLRWASAGHDPPMLYDGERDEFLEPTGEGGLPLGIVDPTDYEENTFANLRSGQILLASTDGLWETSNDQDEQYGKQRVCELIRQHKDKTAAELSDLIRSSVETFRGELLPDDDVTFVVVKVL